MAQRPAELTPLASTQHFFGAELRHWRLRRGMSLAQLGHAVYACGDLIGKVEKARRWPSAALVKRCETVLDSGGVLLRLYLLAARDRRASTKPMCVDDSASAASPNPVVVVVPVHAADELWELVGQAGMNLMPPGVVRLAQVADLAGGVVDLDVARTRRADRAAGKAVAVVRRRRP